MTTKYVVLDYQGLDCMFVFPDFVTHADFVRSMNAKDKVISAGFISLGDEPRAYGQSVSLGVDARPDEDTALLRLLVSRTF